MNVLVLVLWGDGFLLGGSRSGVGRGFRSGCIWGFFVVMLPSTVLRWLSSSSSVGGCPLGGIESNMVDFNTGSIFSRFKGEGVLSVNEEARVTTSAEACRAEDASE